MLLTRVPASPASYERLVALLSHETPQNRVPSLSIVGLGMIDSAFALNLDSCRSLVGRWLGRASRSVRTGTSGRWTSYQGSPALTRDTNLAIRVEIPAKAGFFELDNWPPFQR